MNLKSLIARFNQKGKNKDQLYIVIQADAIYISGSASSNSRFPIDASWESTLKAALSTIDINGQEICVILSSQLYNNYQIDKPELPEEEWSGALPFLLKDLITERTADIVADGYALPDGKKAQTYTLSKTVLTPLLNIIEEAGAELVRIIPEDEAWGYAQIDIANFLFLSRSEKANFKIGAYVENKIRFQRTIRGVVAPLTGTAMSELQIDSLALELQRSMDYLSSQIRDVSINQLILCCDEEFQLELATALNDRLGIKAQALADKDSVCCGEVLLNTAQFIPKEGINLYPAYLKPKKEWFTLTNVAVSWLVAALLMGGIYGYYSIQSTKNNKILAQTSRELAELNKEYGAAQKKLEKHKPNPSKLAAAERMLLEIKDKQKSLSAIGKFDTAKQAGYSGVMTSLAKLSAQNISVSSIELKQNSLNLAGLAKTPESVPKWLKQFKNEVELVGRNFEKLTIGRNEDDIVTFNLVTSLDNSPEQEPSVTQEGK